MALEEGKYSCAFDKGSVDINKADIEKLETGGPGILEVRGKFQPTIASCLDFRRKRGLQLCQEDCEAGPAYNELGKMLFEDKS